MEFDNHPVSEMFLIHTVIYSMKGLLTQQLFIQYLLNRNVPGLESYTLGPDLNHRPRILLGEETGDGLDYKLLHLFQPSTSQRHNFQQETPLLWQSEDHQACCRSSQSAPATCLHVPEMEIPSRI
uniref:Putative ovule protein n=1 Tax=Solanum chacoense TaxID=4108 RepID=A0A0V0HSV1_SOLCH